MHWLAQVCRSEWPPRICAIIEKSLIPETRHLYTTIRDELIAEGMLKGENKGRVKGMAQMLNQLLESRALKLTDELRHRIADCKDESLLQRWFQRAITAKTLTEIFDD